MDGIHLIVILLVTNICLACDYIEFGPNHTMCKYLTQGCPIQKGGLSSADKEQLVSTHNEYRQKVANGRQPKQPGATNMKQLKWDEELATIAQRWAEQCNFGHDKERASHKHTKVGQNIHIVMSSSSDESVPVKPALTSWYNEVNHFNKHNIKPFKFTSTTGHYSQLVWAQTELVGCGYAYFKKKGMNTKLLVCNYGPSGNVLDTSMYEIGSACNHCMYGCSVRYPGLCSLPPGL